MKSDNPEVLVSGLSLVSLIRKASCSDESMSELLVSTLDCFCSSDRCGTVPVGTMCPIPPLRKRNKDSTIAYAAFIRSPKVNLNPIKEA
jgi:hypothetical protein